MPSKTPEQKRFMAAVANSPKFAKKVGVPQSVGKEFAKADKAKESNEEEEPEDEGPRLRSPRKKVAKKTAKRRSNKKRKR